MTKVRALIRQHHGRRIEAGEVFELPEGHVDRAVARGHVERFIEEPGAPEPVAAGTKPKRGKRAAGEG